MGWIAFHCVPNTLLMEYQMAIKKNMMQNERDVNLSKMQQEFDDRVAREGWRVCRSCNGYAKLDRKGLCTECTDSPTGKDRSGCYSLDSTNHQQPRNSKALSSVASTYHPARSLFSIE